MAFASDTFTDTDGTTLQTHTPSGGGTWTRHTLNTTDIVISDANRARYNGGASTGTVYWHDATPPSADYPVEADVVMRSDPNASAAGVTGRADTAANTNYTARYNTNGNAWQLFKFVTGTATQLGANSGATLTIDQAYALVLDMVGTTIRLLVDGVEKISQTDSAITAAGKAGLRVFDPTTNTTGMHLDNFSAGVAGTMTVTPASAAADAAAVALTGAAILTVTAAIAPSAAAGALNVPNSLPVAAADAPAAGGTVNLTAASILTVTAAPAPAASGTVGLIGQGILAVVSASANASADANLAAGGAASLVVSAATASAAADSSLNGQGMLAVTAATALAAGDAVTFDAAARMVLAAALADAAASSSLGGAGVLAVGSAGSSAAAQGALIGAAILTVIAASAAAAAGGDLTGTLTLPGFTFAAPVRVVDLAAPVRVVDLAANSATRSG